MALPKKKSYHHIHKNVHHTNFFLLFILLVAICSLLLAGRFLQRPSEQSAPIPTETPVRTSAQLSFVPSTQQVEPYEVQAGQTFEIELMVDPKLHKVSIVSPIITYDPAVLEVVSVSPNELAFPVELEPANTESEGMITMGVGINLPPDNAVVQPAPVASVTFKVLPNTSGSNTTVSIDDSTNIYSVDPLDGPSADVYDSSRPFYILVL